MSENMQLILMLGILIFIFGAYFAALAIAGWYDKKEREKRGELPMFDERQRLARLRAGNHALYALIVFLILWTALDQLGYDWLGDSWSMLLCALLLAWGIWAADCIRNDGFISWKHKGMSNAYAFSVLAILIKLFNTFHSSGIIKTLLPFIFWCADALLLIVVIVYKRRKDKQVEKECDDL